MTVHHEITPDGESTAKWAMRQPGFMVTYKQLCNCGRCGEPMRGGPHKKQRIVDAMKPSMHWICDDCNDQLPER